MAALRDDWNNKLTTLQKPDAAHIAAMLLAFELKERMPEAEVQDVFDESLRKPWSAVRDAWDIALEEWPGYACRTSAWIWHRTLP
jgi:hypothetical protein